MMEETIIEDNNNNDEFKDPVFVEDFTFQIFYKIKKI